MKLCMQTSEGGLQGCMLTCEGGAEVAGVKVCTQTYEGRLKVWVQTSGEGLQARVQTWDQAWKLACKLPQHLHSTVGGLKFWSNFARWVEFFMPMHAQGGWNLACKIKREVESFHAILESNLYKIQIRKGLIRRDNCKVKGWAFRQEIDDPGLLS